MAILLNKIDPVIINNVQKQTVEEVVHTYERTKISKDKKEEQGSGHSKKKAKEKVDKFNSILEVMGADMNLQLEGDSVIAVDKDGKVIKRYTKDAVVELLDKMQDMIGVFIDIKK